MKRVADEWINTSINFDKLKQHSDNLVLINSDDYPYVPLSGTELFKDNLGTKIVMLNNITEEDGVTELPVVLEELLKIAE